MALQSRPQQLEHPERIIQILILAFPTRHFFNTGTEEYRELGSGRGFYPQMKLTFYIMGVGEEIIHLINPIFLHQRNNRKNIVRWNIFKGGPLIWIALNGSSVMIKDSFLENI